MRIYFFKVSHVKVLEKPGVKDVLSQLPALLLWPVYLPVYKILQLAFSPAGAEDRSDSEGRLAVCVKEFREHSMGDDGCQDT